MMTNIFFLLLNDRLSNKTFSGSLLHGNHIVFFASLLEKIKQLTKPPEDSASVQPPHIMLADDDEDDRQLFEEAISHINPIINVETVQNGSELIDKMKQGSQPALIFLDLNMPGKTGKECLQEIREHDDWKNIPVVIYSTSANKKDIHDTYRGGANLYLLKPTSFSELIRVIRKAFTFDWEQNPRLPQNDFVLTHIS